MAHDTRKEMDAPLAPVAVDSLHIGTLRPLGPRNVPTGIYKQQVQGPQIVTELGLSGDHQGDKRHHGGAEKALHHYARDHYSAWLADDPGLAEHLAPPAFGENISTLGMTEANVCIGDVYRLGTTLLQVSQGRQPCWRLNARFDRPDMAFRVQKTGRTGWYYRVLREGTIAPGDLFRLDDRPQPHWPLTRVIELLYTRTLDMEALAQLRDLPELAASWRDLAARRIATHSVEDWNRRLHNPQ